MLFILGGSESLAVCAWRHIFGCQVTAGKSCPSVLPSHRKSSYGAVYWHHSLLQQRRVGLYCKLLETGLSHFSQMALGSWGRSNLNHHSYFPNEYKARAHSSHIAQSQSISQLKIIPSHWVYLGMQHRTCRGWQLSAASGWPAGWLYGQSATVVPRSTSAEASE